MPRQPNDAASGRLAQLDAIRVQPRVTRAFEAGENGMAVLAFGAHHDKDGEVINGFCKD